MLSLKVQINFAFTLQPEEPQMNEPINFVAPNEEVYNIWMDGINALLGKVVSIEISLLSTMLSAVISKYGHF